VKVVERVDKIDKGATEAIDANDDERISAP